MEVFNDVLLEQLADQGNGFYAFVDTAQEAERLFTEDLTGTLEAVALDAKVQVTFDPEQVASFRLLGYENREIADEEFTDDGVDGGEIGAGHTVTALYEVTLPEAGVGDDAAPLATVDLRWVDPDTDEVVEASDTLSASGIASEFGDAPERLRQDVLVAAFAEGLRGAPWGEQVSLSSVADNTEALASGDLADDDVAAELAALTRTAADL
jgi:Ca-activated chloride channel family protein